MTAFCIAAVALASCRQLSGVSDFRFRGEEGGGGEGGAGPGGVGGSATAGGSASASSTGGAGGAGGAGGPITWTQRRDITLDFTTKSAISDFPLLIVLTPDRINYG